LSVTKLPIRTPEVVRNVADTAALRRDPLPTAPPLIEAPRCADASLFVGTMEGLGSLPSYTWRKPPANLNGIRAALLDVLIIPLAASAFAAKTTFRSLLRLLVNVLDWTFPIVMQGARIPLFLTRIVGDVLAAGLSALVWFVPLSTTRRRELQAMIASGWARLQKRISYRAFEEALHHAFERGMSFVFRACRDLSPRSALLVICAAAAWFPITFGTSTVMHAFLLANATTLPAWMQIFHFPVALMAKSKILVLPVYPAAWPQAKRHWFVVRVQEVLRTFKWFAVVRRLALRYRQTESGAHRLGGLLIDIVVSTGPFRASATALGCSREAAAFRTGRLRSAARRVSASASRLWLIGPYVRGLLARFSRTAPRRTSKPSERIRLVYKRWAVKFTSGYYEAKERQIAHSPS
jgi:transposase